MNNKRRPQFYLYLNSVIRLDWLVVDCPHCVWQRVRLVRHMHVIGLARLHHNVLDETDAKTWFL